MNAKLKLSPLVLGAAVLVIILIAGGIWYWRSKKTAPAAPTGTASGAYAPTAEKTGGSIGTAIFEKSQNPIVDKQPETNPFGKVKINPLKSIYTNPFE